MNIKNLNMRRAARSVRPAAVAGLVLAALGAAACGSDDARKGQARRYPVITVLEGASGAGGCGAQFFTNAVASDVITFIKSKNAYSVFKDLGRVTMTAAMRDVTNPNGPTANNAITINRYRVVYRRSDGRNTPGVDVPYAFDGAVTFTVVPGRRRERAVRARARPGEVRGAAGAADRRQRRRVSISTIADVTFYGQDQTGREVAGHRDHQRELRRLGRPGTVGRSMAPTTISCAG